mmetsp:Transcript_28918/g.93215  ORF Transcript_28918/g.93215 Transcript_28918/m.93215 type:complete len:82 (-) Transcript_28918:1026-1271(-)
MIKTVKFVSMFDTQLSVVSPYVHVFHSSSSSHCKDDEVESFLPRCLHRLQLLSHSSSSPHFFPVWFATPSIAFLTISGSPR